MGHSGGEQEDGRSRRGRERREATREHILHVASGVFRHQGYRATTVADVILSARIARGTFYLHFDSIESVFHELIDRFVALLISAVVPIDPARGRALEEMKENVRRVVHVLWDNPDLTTLLFREAVAADPQTDDKLRMFDAFMHDMALGALENGVTWGVIREVSDRNVVASAIIGSLREVLYQGLVLKRFDARGPEAIAEAVIDFGMRGLERT